MAFLVHDRRFHDLVPPEARMEPISTGHRFTEGTIWHPRGGYLVFSDMGVGVIYRWSPVDGLSILRKPSNIANGNFVDRQGRIVSCEHATSCVSRIESGGRHIRVLASHYRGNVFNSPNDLIVDSMDRIWFTDPTYGRTSSVIGLPRERELDFQGVYRLDPDGSVTLVADDYVQPNGLCLTPDERFLLVNDTEQGHIRRYVVNEDGSLSGGDVLATISGYGPGKPDGMKVDVHGNIYCNGPGGVHVLTPDGAPLGVIRTPEQSRNFCFGGADSMDLFIAASSTIYRLRMAVRGVAPPQAEDGRVS